MPSCRVLLCQRAKTPCAPLAHGKEGGAVAPLIPPFRDVSVERCGLIPFCLLLFIFLSILFFIFICFVFILLYVIQL